MCGSRVISVGSWELHLFGDENLGSGPLNLEWRLKDHFISVCKGRMERRLSQAPLRPNGVTRGNGCIPKHSILWNWNLWWLLEEVLECWGWQEMTLCWHQRSLLCLNCVQLSCVATEKVFNVSSWCFCSNEHVLWQDREEWDWGTNAASNNWIHCVVLESSNREARKDYWDVQEAVHVATYQSLSENLREELHSVWELVQVSW